VIRVGVIGHAGRMGSEVCRAVEDDVELELVARIGRGDDLGDLTRAGAEVAVEFTTPDTVKDNVVWCVKHDIHVVVGATGLSDDDIDEIGALVKDGSARVFVAPNFALGAVLMMAFSVRAARYYDTCEIVERHHERKLDSPSGTSLRTAALINEAHRGSWPPREERETLAGSRGGDAEGVHVHSLRMPGSVAHQEVIFGGAGETLTIRHDSLDRSSFMPGVILAVKSVAQTDGVTVGLEHLLGLSE
jgi:4-hydroxy-tetrahydrodipicolinate reductase